MRLKKKRKEIDLHLGTNGSHKKVEGHYWKAEI